MGRVSTQNRHELPQNLAGWLQVRGQEVAAAWAERVVELAAPDQPDLTWQQAHDTASHALAAVVESLTTDSREGLEACLSDLSQRAVRDGYRAAEIIEALLVGREALISVLRLTPGVDPAQIWDLCAEWDGLLRWMTGHFSDLYSAETNRLLKKQREQTAQLLATAQAASSTLEIDEVLAMVATMLSKALGMRSCIVVEVDEEHRLVTFKPTAITDARAREAADRLGYFDRSLSFEELDGFSLEVIEKKVPLTTYDAGNDPRIPPERVQQWGSKSWLGVPCVASDHVVALAWVITLDRHYAFQQEQIDLARGIASVVGLAIENARLYQRAQQLAVMEERVRLSREIHDNLAQTLGSMQLKASFTHSLLTASCRPQVRIHLEELQDLISQAYTNVREQIFNLRALMLPGITFLPNLHEYLTDYRAHYGIHVQLYADEEAVAALPSSAHLQLFRIIQEALTNVRKHAQVQQARVTIQPGEGDVVISIVDEGRGFDPVQLAAAQDQPHFGLQVMRERAAAVGASFELTAHPGEGTCVQICVPLTKNGEAQ
jgi:signal transduction histidine kinase